MCCACWNDDGAVQAFLHLEEHAFIREGGIILQLLGLHAAQYRICGDKRGLHACSRPLCTVLSLSLASLTHICAVEVLRAFDLAAGPHV